MENAKKFTALLLSAGMLCSCASAPAETVTETSGTTCAATEETAAAVATTTTAVASTSAAASVITTTSKTTSETTAETIGTDEEITDISLLCENEKAKGYMAALLECELFSETLSVTDEVQVTDLNADGAPEILLCCAPPTVTAVFSFDENGKCVFIEPSEDSYTLYDDKPFYSYDGFTLEPYSKDGKDIFITNCFLGGSNVGQGGYIEVSFKNGKIVSKPLCGYNYHSVFVEGISGSEYWFGSPDNTMSEKEYNKKLEEYLAECEPSDILLRHIPSEMFCHVDSNEKLENLAKALDEYLG